MHTQKVTMKLGRITTLAAYELSLQSVLQLELHAFTLQLQEHLNACKLYQAIGVQVTTSFGV